MKSIYLFFLSLLFYTVDLSGAFISLKGYLNKESLQEARSALDQKPTTLILEIDSTGGDLGQILDLAKKIYELKKLQGLKVITYIHDNAIGPAAIFPFLADEIDSGLSTTWGDIPLGTEGALPPHILRNRVRSLIDSQNPKANVLYQLADAMSDPSQTFKEQPTPGQTLVLNQNQLEELGLIKEVLTPEQFFAKMDIIISSKPTSLAEAPLQLSLPTVEKKLEEHIHFKQDENQIGYLYIGDHETAISESTWLYVKQGLEYYKKNPPIFIILELNTPGGEVFAAQKISDALKEMDTQLNIPVVAFINNWAISAGAMLAYSCRFITVVKDGSMGAAEPVLAGEGGKMESASEKVNSAIRADFGNRARFFDRNPLIAEGMVDKDLILVLRHGAVVRLDNESQIRLTGPDPDKVISPKGKLITLNGEELIEYGVADLMLLPKKLPDITPEEKTKGVWNADKMLLFQEPFFSKIPKATIHAYQMDWKTKFFVFLATPLISSLLLMGLMIGGYIELNHPGVSLPGFVAGVCLFLIILSSYSLEIANWLELIILLTGVILILTELFILPTFGLLGILGIVLFIGGLFAMLLPNLGSVQFEYDTHTLNAAGEYFFQRLAWACGAMILSVLVIFVLARYVLPSFSAFNPFVLVGNEQEGYIAGEQPNQLPKPGTPGKVFATLRPAGKIIINDQIYDAISAGDFIESGEEIIVVRLEGSVIVVNRGAHV